MKQPQDELGCMLGPLSKALVLYVCAAAPRPVPRSELVPILLAHGRDARANCITELCVSAYLASDGKRGPSGASYTPGPRKLGQPHPVTQARAVQRNAAAEARRERDRLRRQAARDALDAERGHLPLRVPSIWALADACAAQG